MRLLHTSDWHVGKKLRGIDRSAEHRGVLAEIVDLTRTHEVDIVLVAGDLFDSAAPAPDSEAIVYDTLLELAESASVAVIAGNHDNARRLSAMRRLFDLGNVTVVAEPARPGDGGVLRTEIDGEPLRLAMLPFVSQRGIVRAGDLMAKAAFEHTAAYADRQRVLIEALTSDFGSDTVNVVMTHGYVVGGALGGGERAAHVVHDYAVPATVFPPTVSYVALGHLHRAQKIAGPTSIHYCGSPLQLDFGETDQAKQVKLIEVEPGLPPDVRPLSLQSGRELRTIEGGIDAVEAAAANVGDAWLRVIIDEPRQAGLADQIRRLLGDSVVDVVIAAPPDDPGREVGPKRIGRSPRELFDEYLAERGLDDDRLSEMFDDLLDLDESVLS